MTDAQRHVIAIAYYAKAIGAVLAFWSAYVLTRPLGASAGDYLTQAPKHGGLGLSTMTVSSVFLVIIVALAAYLTITGVDSIERDGAPAR